MKIYTKTGDTGQTGLIGVRVDKDNLTISTIGTLDELNSLLGMIRAKCPLQNVCEAVKYLQGTIFTISARIADSGKNTLKIPDAKNLEEVIDEIEKILPPLQNFILPGGHETAAALHHARSVCRRVERLIVALNKKVGVDVSILKFINRTSDFLFVMARYVNHHYMIHETIWEGGSPVKVDAETEGTADTEETVNTITIDEALEAVEATGEVETETAIDITPEIEPVEEKAAKKAKVRV